MAQVNLICQHTDGRDVVFAYLNSGQPVWGMDRATRQEWWYAPERADDVRDSIRAGLLELERPPKPAPVLPPTPTAPSSHSPVGTSPRSDGSVDLATHLPGHAVLAQIYAQHSQATSAVIEGEPGVLDEGITSWCVGYVGEEKVGAALAALGPGWRVLHAVPVGSQGSDIDHVVVGHGGVFTINTKHHAGLTVDVKGDAVFVGRTYQRYVPNARLDAARTNELLVRMGAPMTAYPIIVTVGARLRIKQAADGVYVMDAVQLRPWLLSLPPVLSTAQVESIFAAMRPSNAWTATAPPPAAPTWVADFARHLATERAIVSGQRRRARTASRLASPKPATRPGSPSRRRTTARASTSVRSDLLRLALVLAVFASIALFAPPLIRAFVTALAPHPASAPPTPTQTTSTHTAGTACPLKGATTTDPAGRAMVCAAKSGSTALSWHLR